ncbi:MAG: AEC family transporter [Rhodospirillales bacterium]|nr:AEC family transporter [Rhodospirillales bacterium]
MSAVAAALAPVFGLIALGVVLKRYAFRDDGFWEPVERLTYFVLFPPLLVTSIAEARIDGIGTVQLIAAALATMAAIAVLLFALRRHMGVNGPAFTSVVQGSLRFNTYVALAVAAGLHGKGGLALLAIVLAFAVPLGNAISVLALARYGMRGGAKAPSVASEVAKNPLILASLAGLALSLADIAIPATLSQMSDILGRGSLALGLLTVGAGLSLGHLREHARGLALASVPKLVLAPALIWFLATRIGLDPVAVSIAVVFAAQPCATSSYILARRLGGDASLMASIVSGQVVLAAVTLPLALALLG